MHTSCSRQTRATYVPAKRAALRCENDVRKSNFVPLRNDDPISSVNCRMQITCRLKLATQLIHLQPPGSTLILDKLRGSNVSPSSTKFARSDIDDLILV